jgi:rubrerythrin
MVKNQNLTVARGELPPADTWPEVWVIDNAKAQEAMDILSQAKSMQYTAADEWVCPGCGEKIEGQFTSCWNCGREKD